MMPRLDNVFVSSDIIAVWTGAHGGGCQKG